MIEYCDEILNKCREGFLISPLAFKIGEAAITGMLYEAGAYPKPGLVTPNSNGTHSDMDFFTFLRSTSSISASMCQCAQIGMDYDDNLLKKIRSIGITGEKNMFDATNGVNTQKGLLFVGGIVSAAAGNCIRKKLKIDRHNISKISMDICSGLVKNELENLDNKGKLTNGEKLYLEYGVTGIRGELEKGLPSIINVGLPFYENAVKKGIPPKEALVQSLIGLMTVVEDTVVINRSGLEGLNYMVIEAKKALELGGIFTLEGQAYIIKMEDKFINKKISPGGVADLLAITVMIYELENQKLFEAEMR